MASRKARTGVEFNYLSHDGDDGFPGNVKVKVSYTLTDGNAILIDYEATTDKATPINLTQHSYFNLAGEGSGDILNHEVMINADHFTPVDKGLIPTGELRPVKGTPFDLTKPTRIGAHIDDNYEQLTLGWGYDHNFVINSKPDQNGLKLAARVHEPTSGRTLEVWTTQPGVQFYTGNHLDGIGHRQARPRLQEARRVLPGDAALSRLTEPSEFSQHDSEAGRDVPREDGIQVRGEITGAMTITWKSGP